MSGVGADLPARVQALQAELAALRDDMQRFASAVSHDLRAPLRHIVSYTQLVQEDTGEQLSSEVQGFLRTITDSAQHMGLQLDGLTAWSRVGTADLQLQPVDLQALVQAVCASLAAKATTVPWVVATDLPTVWGDPGLLRQALEQILGNAIKFSAGQARAAVSIAPWQDAAHGLAGLCVQDHGAGYNPAQQAALFQVFGRLHSAQQFPGVGMGLAITRRIMERLGGEVSIHSPGIGQGATVRLALPLPPA